MNLGLSKKFLIVLVFLLTLVRPCEGRQTSEEALAILHQHYEATGGLERFKNIQSNFSEGRIRFDGLEGTFKHWEKLPLQYRTEENYGIIAQTLGDSGDVSWLLDTNGQLLLMRDQQTLERREIGRRLALYEHLAPDSPFFTLTYEGLTQLNDVQCQEVVLTNSLNSDEAHFYFDLKTHYMVRSEVRQPDITIISDYGDFRWVDGFLVSFYSHTRFVEWQKEEETWTSRYQIDVSPTPALFQPPAERRDYHFPADQTRVTVPFLFMENLIHLPVTIHSHTGYWVLDSGASMSVIDEDYARQQNLQLEGSIKGYGFGELFDLGFTTVPGFRVGDIEFDSQKWYVAKGLHEKSYEPEIFGILGYDFLSRFVVEIDYDKQLVTFHEPENFHYVGNGVVLDSPLKYRTFTLPVVLDGKYSSIWSLDLGSYHSSIHYQFAEKNGLLDRPGVETVSQGVSGISFEKTAAFGCLSIDRFQLANHLLSIPQEKGQGATALGEIGGNIGNSTLKHFHIFLDYPRQQLILEPGRFFKHHFARDGSGLLVGKSADERPMVSFIAANTPAAEAGLEAGDIILSINGVPVETNQPIMPLRNLLRGAAGTEIHIAVLRNDERLEKSFTLRDLYPIQGLGDCDAAGNQTAIHPPL